MQQEIIREFYGIIHAFETMLYALKWQRHENSNHFGYDAEIEVFDSTLRRLKECCINNIGCPEE